MKNKMLIPSVSLALTLGANAVTFVVTDESASVTNYSDLIGLTTGDIVTSHSGAFGSFDSVLTVSATDAAGNPVAMGVVGNNFLDASTTNFTFTVSTANLALNSGFSITGEDITFMRSALANGPTETSTMVLPSGSFTWIDANDGVDIVGQTGANLDLVLMNGGADIGATVSTINTDGIEWGWRQLDYDIEITERIPEPSSAALLGLGGLALIARRRRS